MTRGTTLIEVAGVLLILGLLVATAMPASLGLRDTAAVISARERVAGVIAEARAKAVGRGGTVVHVDSARVWMTQDGAEARSISLARTLGVRVEGGRRSQVDIPFDALGLGRVASTTLTFRRGAAARTLVVSSYGRVRR